MTLQDGHAEPSPLRGEGRVRGSASGRAPASSVKRSRSLRRSETEAEHVLWQFLRNRQLVGHKFVRQFPVGPYFADFACREAALIIELDGSQHVGSVTDVARTAFLNGEGYSVLRFWNNDVLTNLQGVAESILAALALHPSPGERFAPATLSPEGRGSKGTSAATTMQRLRANLLPEAIVNSASKSTVPRQRPRNPFPSGERAG